MLQTPYEKVYSIDEPSASYTGPKELVGVPVAKLNETDGYWSPRWLSLDDFLAREAEEERLKTESARRQKLEPENQLVAKIHKRHQDNCSKHRKIREIFGPTTNYHPNQLVNKGNLPAQGLCDMETMYKLACKITDLVVLQSRGELAMDPWDFLRWRIIKKAREIEQPMPYFGLKSICDDSGLESAEKYEDRLLRVAILRSAKYQGRLNAYAARKVTKPTSPTEEGISSRNFGARPLPVSAHASVDWAARELEKAEERKLKRRARIQSQPSTYQGVNAYRLELQQKREREAREAREAQK
ncbi:hypothetical protein B0T10DRAFT_594106 [Thelonectria olida]|uniref:Uncharacterized protein n=1 Tax=Thelonectria olida TaxID=1576542 RepID=A0A9P9AR54_9HYPO|nr:hypothetical protein B0T10DRAFT_594106 [Thelonectria olida]